MNTKSKLLKRSASTFQSRKKPSKTKSSIKAGSGGLKSTKKLNLKRVLPLIIAVAIAGGYLVYQSFAGTYSVCKTAQNDDQNSTYNLECVLNSDEAAVIRLYQTIFNSSPAQKELSFWSERLLSKKATLPDVAKQSLESERFKTMYGSLDDQKFIELMYRQALGRQPDAASRQYWQERLKSNPNSRPTLVVTLVRSDEVKNRLKDQVARTLAISTFSPLDTSKRSITDGLSIVTLAQDEVGSCSVSVVITEKWLKESKTGSVDIAATDQGEESRCSNYEITKLRAVSTERRLKSTKTSRIENASSKDIDARPGFESLQLFVEKKDRLLRLSGVYVELRDFKNKKCYEYRADLGGNLLNPRPMSQTAVRGC